MKWIFFRIVLASQDIEAGQMIFSEYPVVKYPQWKASPVCPGQRESQPSWEAEYVAWSYIYVLHWFKDGFFIKKAWKLHSIDKSIFIWKPCNMVWYLQTEEIFQSISFQFTTTNTVLFVRLLLPPSTSKLQFSEIKIMCENSFGNSKLTLEKPRHDIKKYFIPQCCELIDHDSTLAFLRSFRP